MKKLNRFLTEIHKTYNYELFFADKLRNFTFFAFEVEKWEEVVEFSISCELEAKYRNFAEKSTIESTAAILVRTLNRFANFRDVEFSHAEWENGYFYFNYFVYKSDISMGVSLIEEMNRDNQYFVDLDEDRAIEFNFHAFKFQNRLEFRFTAKAGSLSNQTLTDLDRKLCFSILLVQISKRFLVDFLDCNITTSKWSAEKFFFDSCIPISKL